MKFKRVLAAGILGVFFVVMPCVVVTCPAEVAVESAVVLEESVEVEPVPQPAIQMRTEVIKIQEPEVKKNEKQNKEVSDYVYTTTHVNIRTDKSTDSDVFIVAAVGTKLHRIGIDDEWDTIEIDDNIYYISNQYITTEEVNYKLWDVPKYSGFKSYMPYTAITNRSSNQYKIQNTYAYTGNYGIRQVDGRYCVALGSYFNVEIGQYFDLILANGTVIQCIMGDAKADKDTDGQNIFSPAGGGCMSEFLIDRSAFNYTAKQMGDVSYCCEEWRSPVVKVKIYETNILK